ncbi:MAG: hydantoinase/oxoprolinase family protein [Alphaproteobacteria bacterium]|nr:hydantoinase/oxoprolinase family protein [Alphaproteobacteria bacterium]
MPYPTGYRLGIDIGGTFTDFALYDELGESFAIHKQLTTPDDPARAVLEGTTALLDQQGLDLSSVVEIVHGTTLVTNAVIERKGAVTGMLTTRGFRDILDMRQEKRYDVFDLRLVFPDPLVPRRRRAEVNERVHYDGTIEHALDMVGARAVLADLVARENITSLAICLLHGYANPAHERALGEMAADAFPDLTISLSSEVCPEWREYERFTTTCINAFTQPMFDQYLRRLEHGLTEQGFAGQLFVMSSSGGTLTPETARKFPVRVIESGPAAGAQMSAFHGRALNRPELLSFDMGGTTAKGALIRGGEAIKVYFQEVARVHDFKAGSGLPVKSPVIDMIEIGAGGGSIATLDVRGTISVGPQSAGADPGPACYGQGGKAATLTDANVVLGYLDPNFFLGGAMALDVEAAERVIETQIATPLKLPLARAAWGIHEIVDEDVARAFRIHASERGFDYRGSSMVAFGGSGPVHAMGVARKLGIPRVIFPVAAGVMSALGLLASPLTFEVARTKQAFVADLSMENFSSILAELEAEARAPLQDADTDLSIVRRLDMRYNGQGHEIEVTLPPGPETGIAALPDIFREHYAAIHGAALLDTPLVITTWKVEATANAPELTTAGPEAQGAATPKGSRQAYFDEGYVTTPVYDRYNLAVGTVIEGPALIEERESTVIIGPGEKVDVDEFGNLVAELEGAP